MFEMNHLNMSVGLATALSLAGCGGGSSGASSGGTTAPVSTDSLLKINLIGAAETPYSPIGASGYTVLNVTLRDPSGNPIPDQVQVAVTTPGLTKTLNFTMPN